jgi:hypothetical protein
VDQRSESENVRVEITEQIFANSPTMLALCLTMIGLIKIYTALNRVTTLTDDFLVFCIIAFLLATIFSYLSLRSVKPRSRIMYARFADGLFISGLSAAVIIAVVAVYSLAG